MGWRWFWAAVVVGTMSYRLRSWSSFMHITLSPQLDTGSIAGLWLAGTFIFLFLITKVGLVGYVWRSIFSSEPSPTLSPLFVTKNKA